MLNIGKEAGVNSFIDMTQSAMNGAGPARRLTGVGIFGTEATAVLVDSRWVLILMVILIIADFRFGMRESKKHYEEAKEDGDKVRMDYYKWHPCLNRTFMELKQRYLARPCYHCLVLIEPLWN